MRLATSGSVREVEFLLCSSRRTSSVCLKPFFIMRTPPSRSRRLPWPRNGGSGGGGGRINDGNEARSSRSRRRFEKKKREALVGFWAFPCLRGLGSIQYFMGLQDGSTCILMDLVSVKEEDMIYGVFFLVLAKCLCL